MTCLTPIFLLKPSHYLIILITPDPTFTTDKMAVNGLDHAFAMFTSILASVQQARAFREQLRVLADCTSILLKVLDKQYRTGELTEEFTQLQDLNKFDSMFLLQGYH